MSQLTDAIKVALSLSEARDAMEVSDTRPRIDLVGDKAIRLEQPRPQRPTIPFEPPSTLPPDPVYGSPKPDARGRVEVMEGVWIDPEDADRGNQRIWIETKQVECTLLVNSFANDGIPLSVILPGQMKGETKRYDFPDPGTAHPKALPLVEKWRSSMSGFTTLVPNGTLYGPKQANQPGGDVYGEFDWAFGSELGLTMCHLAGMGASSRHLMWRFDRNAWREGRLEPAKFGPDFPGFDKTRSQCLPGYSHGVIDKDGRDLMQKVEGFDSYDSSHISRLGNYLYFSAKHGNAFAKLALRVLADEVRLGWCEDNTMSRHFDKDGPHQYSWFGCQEIILFYPPGIGCHLLGRGFGQDLIVLCNAEELFPGRYTRDLALMSQVIAHCWNEQFGIVYMIPPLDPIWYQPISAWQQKLNVENDTMPPGALFPVAKTFEAAIVHKGMVRFRDVIRAQMDSFARDTPLDDIISRHAQTLLGFNHELRVVGAEKYGDLKETRGTKLVLGVEGDPWLGGKSLEEAIGNSAPVNGDRPEHAAHPSLWN